MKIVDIFVTLILSSKGGKIYLVETGDSKLLAGMTILSSVTYSLCVNNPGGNRKISSDQKKTQHDGNRMIKKGYIHSISLSCRVGGILVSTLCQAKLFPHLSTALSI